MKQYERHTEPGSIMDQQLECLKENLTRGQYPGYPAAIDRLYAHALDFYQYEDGTLLVQDGPWTINEHPNRTDTERFPTPDKQVELRRNGFELDSFGRPLHPWFDYMVSNPAIGVVTGKGFYRDWGPNTTADPIVKHDDKLLLISRGDTGDWALPGGFVDPHEDSRQAALRELWEETGLILPPTMPSTVAYNGITADIRTTANSWASTTAHYFDVPTDFDCQIQPNEVDPKEIREVAWHPIADVLAGGIVYGSHLLIIKLALSVAK